MSYLRGPFDQSTDPLPPRFPDPPEPPTTEPPAPPWWPPGGDPGTDPGGPVNGGGNGSDPEPPTGGGDPGPGAPGGALAFNPYVVGGVAIALFLLWRR